MVSGKYPDITGLLDIYTCNCVSHMLSSRTNRGELLALQYVCKKVTTKCIYNFKDSLDK